MVLSDAFSYLEKKHLHHQHLMKLTLVPCAAGLRWERSVARCGGSKVTKHSTAESNIAKISGNFMRFRKVPYTPIGTCHGAVFWRRQKTSPNNSCNESGKKSEVNVSWNPIRQGELRDTHPSRLDRLLHLRVRFSDFRKTRCEWGIGHKTQYAIDYYVNLL